jgi:hypothetical protein
VDSLSWAGVNWTVANWTLARTELKTVTAFTSRLVLAENYFELNCFENQTELASLGTRYITSAPTTHKNVRLYCWNMCTNHCIAMVAALINYLAVCCLATSSEHSFFYCCVTTNRRDVFTSALRSNERGVTQQRAINTRTSKAKFYFCVPFEGSVASTVPAWGKHATLLHPFSSRTALRCVTFLFFRGLCLQHLFTMVGVIFFSVVQFLPRWSLSNRYNIFTEKLIVAHLFKKLSTFHGIQILILLFNYGLF